MSGSLELAVEKYMRTAQDLLRDRGREPLDDVAKVRLCFRKCVPRGSVGRLYRGVIPQADPDASALDAGYTAQQLKSARSLPHANRGHETHSSITTTETHQGNALLPTRPQQHPRRPASLRAAGSQGAL